MTSEAFVYIMLPGETSSVTAGRFVPTEDRYGAPLGRFIYGRRYLARPNAVALDPIELPLAERTYETHRLKGMFGALRDASPDYWGRRVIEKHAGLTHLGEIDYLLHSPDDRASALSFISELLNANVIICNPFRGAIDAAILDLSVHP